MAQHIKLDQDKDTLILDVAKTALRTAKSAQTRKGGSAFYPIGAGQGVLVGGMADHGVDKWDPETGVQSPLWEGISQEELDAKADEILAAADESTKAQIDKVNKDLQDTSDRIDLKAEEILEAAKADATAKADAVDQKVQAANSKVQANADAIEAARGNARELLYNGGFEHGADGWTTNIAAAGFAQQSPWCRSGGWRAYLNSSAGTRELVSTKPVAVTVGNRYRFRAWYKLLTALSGNDNGGLRLQYTSEATVTDNTVWTDFLPLVNMQFNGDAWSDVVQEVVIPDGVKWVRARVAFTSPVDAYFDDCSIIDATDVVALEAAARAAQATADEARQTALGAQETADGKNAIYRQTTDPALDPVTAGKLVAGDLWWQTSEANLETYWLGEPNNSVSVLVDHSDEIEAMWIWNGSRWNRHVLYAQDVLVNGSIVAELLAVDCVEARHIKVGAIEADKLAATALYGHVIKGGTFLTSNERLVIDNEGLLLKDSGGNATITMLASNGSATFRDVSIIDGSLTTPSLISSDIQGGTVSGATVTGGTVQTVTDANRGIKMTGGNLDIYRADKTRFLRANEAGLYINDGSKDVLSFAPINGEWALTLDGAIQSGGEISGPVITAPTIQTSSAENTGLKLTTGGLVAYDTDGNVTFTLDNTGRIMMSGALMSNASLTGATINGGVVYGATVTTNQNYASTDPTLRDRGVWIKSNGLVSYDASNRETVRIDAANGRLWTRDGISTNGAFSVIDMSERPLLELGADANGHATFTIYVNDLDSAIDRRRLQYVDHVGNDHRMFILWGNNNIAYITQTGWDTARVQSPCVDLGLQTARRGGLVVFRGRVSAPNSGDNTLIDNIGLVAGDGEFSWPNFETYGTNRSAVAAGFRNGVAQPCIVYIPANTRQLVAMNGPWDWVDLTGVTFGQ